MTDPADSPLLLEHLFRHEAGRLTPADEADWSIHVDLAGESAEPCPALQTGCPGFADNAAGWLFRVAHHIGSTSSVVPTPETRPGLVAI